MLIPKGERLAGLPMPESITINKSVQSDMEHDLDTTLTDMGSLDCTC